MLLDFVRQLFERVPDLKMPRAERRSVNLYTNMSFAAASFEVGWTVVHRTASVNSYRGVPWRLYARLPASHQNDLVDALNAYADWAVSKGAVRPAITLECGASVAAPAWRPFRLTFSVWGERSRLINPALRLWQSGKAKPVPRAPRLPEWRQKPGKTVRTKPSLAWLVRELENERNDLQRKSSMPETR